MKQEYALPLNQTLFESSQNCQKASVLKLPPPGHTCHHHQCVYNYDDEPRCDKRQVYDDLDSIISATFLTDKLILLVDVNARVMELTSLLCTDGSTLLMDIDAILERSVEHFNSVLNHPSTVNGFTRLPQMETRKSI